VALRAGNTGRAQRLFEDALAISRRLAEADPGDGQAARDLSISYNSLAQIERANGDLRRAIAYLSQGLAIARDLAAADPVDIGKQHDVFVSLRQLGELLTEAGDEEGTRLLGEAAELASRLGIEPPDAPVEPGVPSSGDG
jgi:tetratricopeptide (TPR) repeat protein